MRRFYAPVTNFDGSSVSLDLEETRHLRDVLRLCAGEQVMVFNGAGREYLCEIQSIGKHQTILQIIEEVAPKSAESRLELTLAVGLLKGEKFDLVVQKACELGVARIVPLKTKRADVRFKDSRESSKKLERWNKIAFEAAKQCGRAKLVDVAEPMAFEKFVETATGLRILFAESGGARFSGIHSDGRITAVVGSEGGWEDAEIQLARSLNFQIVTFGGRILRAETAAIVVSALLQNHFGDLK